MGAHVLRRTTPTAEVATQGQDPGDAVASCGCAKEHPLDLIPPASHTSSLMRGMGLSWGNHTGPCPWLAYRACRASCAGAAPAKSAHPRCP